MSTVIPGWIAERLSKVVVSFMKDHGGTAANAIDELGFRAVERLNIELKGIAPELIAGLPPEFFKNVQSLSHTYLSAFETAALIIVDEDSNAWLPSVIAEASKLKSEGKSEFEATKAAGREFATLRIESLIGLIAGGMA